MLMREWNTIDIAPVMLIKSAEPVYADRAVDTLKNRLRASDPDVSTTQIDAAAYEAGQLFVHIGPSLFAQKRAVIIPNLEQLNTPAQEDIMAYLSQPEDDAVLILRHNGGVRGKKLLDFLKKEAIPTIVISQVKKAADKVKAVQDDVREADRVMTSKAVSALIDALGSDLRELLSGVQQLLADVQGTIDETDVHTYFSGRIEATGFNVADAALAGNTAQAIELARHALSTGVSPVAIISAMAANVRRMAQVLGQRSARGSIIGRKTSVNLAPWQADRSKRDVRYWKPAGIAAALRVLAQADEEVKGASRDPEYAVEKAIIGVTRARRLA